MRRCFVLALVIAVGCGDDSSNVDAGRDAGVDAGPMRGETPGETPGATLLYDLEGGPTLQWLVPDSIREPRPLYVNDREVAFSVLRSPPAIRFKTVARVQLAAFEPIE